MAQKFYVYPTSKNGRILKGFCPTVCESIDDVAEIMRDLHHNLCKHNIEYDTMKIEIRE